MKPKILLIALTTLTLVASGTVAYSQTGYVPYGWQPNQNPVPFPVVNPLAGLARVLPPSNPPSTTQQSYGIGYGNGMPVPPPTIPTQPQPER
jgi:hypothetical protein